MYLCFSSLIWKTLFMCKRWVLRFDAGSWFWCCVMAALCTGKFLANYCKFLVHACSCWELLHCIGWRTVDNWCMIWCSPCQYYIPAGNLTRTIFLHFLFNIWPIHNRLWSYLQGPGLLQHQLESGGEWISLNIYRRYIVLHRPTSSKSLWILQAAW